MNERIKQLFQEAIGYADKTHTYTPEEGFNIQVWDKIRFEKFAELIVKECFTTIKQERYRHAKALETEYDDGYVDGLGRAEKMLEEHFGVEE